MKVKRIVSNIAVGDPNEAAKFYKEILGLDLLMDQGFIATYGSEEMMHIQISFVTEGGSEKPIPDLSVEVDDLEAALDRMRKKGLQIEYGPCSEPWGVRRFFVRDPFGKLINILVHE